MSYHYKLLWNNLRGPRSKSFISVFYVADCHPMHLGHSLENCYKVYLVQSSKMCVLINEIQNKPFKGKNLNSKRYYGNSASVLCTQTEFFSLPVDKLEKDTSWCLKRQGDCLQSDISPFWKEHKTFLILFQVFLAAAAAIFGQVKGDQHPYGPYEVGIKQN